ncbi:MAG TPA: hypothetical protein VGF14_06060 [Alphaproteobacteria bacterium]
MDEAAALAAYQDYIQDLSRTLKAQFTVSTKPIRIIGIEGPSASGKSTAAAIMAEELNALHVKLDSFFQQQKDWPQFNPDRDTGYSSIRYDDAAQCIAAFNNNQPVTFPKYSWQNDLFYDHTLSEDPSSYDFMVIEGTRLLHPQMQDKLDYRILILSDLSSQIETVRNREGSVYNPQKWENDKGWFAQQEHFYREQFDITQAGHIDLIITGRGIAHVGQMKRQGLYI